MNVELWMWIALGCLVLGLTFLTISHFIDGTLIWDKKKQLGGNGE